jgi:SAM-dependent methyltransferase
MTQVGREGATLRLQCGPVTLPYDSDALTPRWLEALEARHLADLTSSEVTRALRALSSWYVERRGALARGRALDGAGKRAAFALFYGPLHFLLVRHIARTLDAHLPFGATLVDLGCGTGVAAAAWAGLSPPGQVQVAGFDRHPWAVAEANWTWRTLGILGQARVAALERARWPRETSAAVVAFTVNELPAEVRARVQQQLLDLAQKGGSLLVVEPLARGVAPWWDEWADLFAPHGGRVDEWRIRADLPELVRRLDRAAGLDHRELKGKTIYVPPR